MEPLNKRVIVKEILEEKTDGGILLPIQQDLPYKKGKVVVAAKDTNSELAGLTIVFNKFTPVEYTKKGEKFLIVKEEDIYLID